MFGIVPGISSKESEMKVVLYFRKGSPVTSVREITASELGEIAPCLEAWKLVERIQLSTGEEFLDVEMPLTEDSLDDWSQKHPEIVMEFKAALIEEQDMLISHQECVEFQVHYGWRVHNMHFVKVG